MQKHKCSQSWSYDASQTVVSLHCMFLNDQLMQCWSHPKRINLRHDFNRSNGRPWLHFRNQSWFLRAVWANRRTAFAKQVLVAVVTLFVSAIKLLIEHRDASQLRQEIPELLVLSHCSLGWAWSGCIISVSWTFVILDGCRLFMKELVTDQWMEVERVYAVWHVSPTEIMPLFNLVTV